MRRLVAILAASSLCLMTVAAVSAYTNYGGGWEADPGQGASSFSASVEQPLNADGSSNFKAKGSGVIPVKFALTQGTGPFVFASYLDAADGPAYSNVVYTPETTTTVSQVTSLSAVYTFTTGDCLGGSLRWQLNTTAGDVFVYFYQPNGVTSCTGANSKSGTNILSIGGNTDRDGSIGSYVDWSAVLADPTYANATINWAGLIIDSGWGGDQIINLTSASFNGITFTVPGASAGTTVCPTAPATFSISKVDGSPSGAVNDVASIQPSDNNSIYRIVDCKYMYNLAIGSLPGVGTYTVYATIASTTFPVASFDLK
jgi:hypothetical protein